MSQGPRADLFSGGEKDEDEEATFAFLVNEILGADAPVLKEDLAELETVDEWEKGGDDEEGPEEEHKDLDEPESPEEPDDDFDINFVDDLPAVDVADVDEFEAYLDSQYLILHNTLLRRRTGDPKILGRLLPWGGSRARPDDERDVKIQCDKHGRGKCFAFLGVARCPRVGVKRRAVRWLLLAYENPGMTCDDHLEAGIEAKIDVGMVPRAPKD